MTQVINPKWVKPNMTLQQAANQAYMRGFELRPSWSPTFGLRIVAVKKDLKGD